MLQTPLKTQAPSDYQGFHSRSFQHLVEASCCLSERPGRDRYLMDSTYELQPIIPLVYPEKPGSRIKDLHRDSFSLTMRDPMSIFNMDLLRFLRTAAHVISNRCPKPALPDFLGNSPLVWALSSAPACWVVAAAEMAPPPPSERPYL